MLDVFAMSGNVQVALANTSSASKYHTPLLPVGNFSTSTPLPPPLNFNDRFLKNEPDDVGVEEKAKLKEEKRMRKVLKRERREQELKEKIEQELKEKLAQESREKKERKRARKEAKRIRNENAIDIDE